MATDARALIQAPCDWHRPLLAEVLARAADATLPHALLLAGPPGIGKARLARAMLEGLLCRRPQGGIACGQCRPCHQLSAGTHPDARVLMPEPGKAQIRIDQVRDLIDFYARSAQYGGARVALIQPAEGLNRSAQNALLKTLEEPGAGACLILVSDQPSRLLATVRSRCQQRLLPLPPVAEARTWLAGQLAQPDSAAALLAAAGGAPLKALAWQQADWFQARAEILQLCLSVLRGSTPASIVAQQLAKYDALPLLAAMHGWVLQGWRPQAADPALQPVLLAILEHAGQRRLLAFAGHLQRARQLLQSGANPNLTLAWERLLLLLAGVDAMAGAF